MVGESQIKTSSDVHCANPSCGTKSEPKLVEGLSAWLGFSSDRSSGYFLGQNWLCSKACLTKQVNDGILEILARPISRKLFKPMGPRIGTFLRARGWISSEQLNEALDLQKKRKLKLGKCLLELEHLSEQKLLIGLSEQLKVPCIFEPIRDVAEKALRLIPKPVCERFHLVPFDYRQNHFLSVAVDIDLNEQIILALREVLGCSVQPYLTTREELQELLKRFILPLPADPVTLIDDGQNLKDQMGRKFLEEWTLYKANKARFAALEDMIWIRYLSADGPHDHLLVSG
jgi:hypothetical protein